MNTAKCVEMLFGTKLSSCVRQYFLGCVEREHQYWADYSGGLHGGVESGLGHTSAMATQCGALYGFKTAPERRESASASAYVYVWLYVHTSHNTPVYVYFQCYLMCCQRIDCKPLMGSKLDIFKVLKKNGTGPEVNPHELYAYPVSMKAPTT